MAWLRREGVWDAVSPEESDFLLSDAPTRQQQFQAQWRAEALFPLLWALGLFSAMPGPQQVCDVPLMQDVLPPLFDSVAKFVSDATLRRDAEILEANEEIYQIHWRVRDFQLRDQPAQPGKFPRMPAAEGGPPAEDYDAGVVQERHHGLNWLIGYCGQDWDEVTTDA